MPPIDKAFEKYLDEKFRHFDTKIDHLNEVAESIHKRLPDAELRLANLEKWKSNEEGRQRGINKMIALMLTIAGITVGALATMLWH